MINKRTLIAWLPVLALMAAIFVASDQPKLPPPEPGEGVYLSGVMPVFTNRAWEILVKKASHVAGYGLLTLLMIRALRANELSARIAAHMAVLMALAYALTDELHQSRVAGRNASALDIGIDCVGAALVALLAWRYAGRHPAKQNLPGQQGDRGRRKGAAR